MFVKNLSFATTEAQLKEHFERELRRKGGEEGAAGIRSVRVSQVPNLRWQTPHAFI